MKRSTIRPYWVLITIGLAATLVVAGLGGRSPETVDSFDFAAPGAFVGGDVRCVLNVFADGGFPVNNGDAITLSVNYSSGAPAGMRTEKFAILWPSTSAVFRTSTVHVKSFLSVGAGGTSLLASIVPTANAVEGTAFPRVDVTFDDGTTCSASTELSII